jgi:hypothetical protein
MNYGNYIVDQNPFRLAGPPSWFLKELYHFDNSLVIFPSRQGFYYRLAQKRPLRLPEHITNDALFKESDTRMLAAHSCVPITTIMALANWSNPLLFEELRKRAPHRMGGSEKVIAEIEAQEAKEEMDRKVKQDDMLNYYTKDAWNLYQKKIGIRSNMYIPKTKSEKRPTIGQAPAIIIASS